MAPVTENTPLTVKDGEAKPAWYQPMCTVICGAAYIGTSSMLINFNKTLMEEGGAFPFSVPLVMIHTGVSSVLTLLLFLLVPSWFPSLTGPEKISVGFDFIFRSAMPIALTFAINLVLSNTAYVHSDVAFLQMMKEANVVLVYFLSVAVALEIFAWRYVSILAFIIGSTFVSIHGALDFSMTGFLIQGGSQIAECIKITLQALILSSIGKKLDVLSYVLIVLPLCFFFLASTLGVLALMDVQDSAFSMPSWKQFESALPLLVPNALLAFTLNVVITIFMKVSSGVAFVLAGILKDVAIVVISVMFQGEIVTSVQTISFTLQCLGIWVWAMMKMNPDHFDNGMAGGILYSLFGLDSRKQAAPDAESSLKP